MESCLYELGEAPDVVDVRMRNENRLDLPRIVLERLKIVLLAEVGALVEAAINEDLCPLRLEEVIRAGDGTRATVECELH